MQFDIKGQISNSNEAPSIEIEGGIIYRPDSLQFEGRYNDEISAQRVKKTWCTILETDFLLLPKSDFNLTKDFDRESGQFVLSCNFTSACGRYAFWRLINEQAPEVQFLLETAHLSHRFEDYESFVYSVTEPARTKTKDWVESISQTVAETIDTLKQLIQLKTDHSNKK